MSGVYRGDGPRNGDTVQVSFPGKWEGTHPGGGHALRVGDALLRVPYTASVEVLERADTPPRYRVGNKNARNIYLVDGDHEVHVGVMFDPDNGPRTVEALNAFPAVATVTAEDIDRWAAEDDVDNEGIVMGSEYAEKARARDPRVFRSDGPEPPRDVQAVTDSHHYLPYLIRFQGGWCWSQEKDRVAGAGRSPGAVEWKAAVSHSQNAELREVLPS